MTQIILSENNKYQQFFQKIIPLRFSCITNAGWPIVLSLWYVYKDGKIYCATQKDAKVIEYLQKNPKCAFEVAPDQPPYKGVRGQGQVKLRKDIAIQILELLIDRYLGNRDSSLAKLLLEKRDNELAIEITPINLFTWDYSKRMKDSSSK